MGKPMNGEELHFFGIRVVYKDLVDQGYEVLNVRKEMDVNPQILARRVKRSILLWLEQLPIRRWACSHLK